MGSLRRLESMHARDYRKTTDSDIDLDSVGKFGRMVAVIIVDHGTCLCVCTTRDWCKDRGDFSTI